MNYDKAKDKSQVWVTVKWEREGKKRWREKEYESVWKYVFTNAALKNQSLLRNVILLRCKVLLIFVFLFIIYNDNTTNSLSITYYESGMVLISF